MMCIQSDHIPWKSKAYKNNSRFPKAGFGNRRFHDHAPAMSVHQSHVSGTLQSDTVFFYPRPFWSLARTSRFILSGLASGMMCSIWCHFLKGRSLHLTTLHMFEVSRCLSFNCVAQILGCRGTHLIHDTYASDFSWAAMCKANHDWSELADMSHRCTPI